MRKTSDHYFFKLSDPRCQHFLEAWTQEDDHLQPEARNKISEWFKQGLNDWDISRDGLTSASKFTAHRQVFTLVRRSDGYWAVQDHSADGLDSTRGRKASKPISHL